MSKQTIAIIDYGMGNIHSVKKAIELMGAKAVVATEPGVLEKSDKMVLPGVGSFGDACAELEKSGLSEGIIRQTQSGKPFLGICLGMQLLLDSSEESAGKGLGLIPGTVRKFKPAKGLKVPQMGWNQLKINDAQCCLLAGISQGSFVYFCHSFYPCPENKNVAAAYTEYGGDFASVIHKENLYGVQFHPEKSQKTGLDIVSNFLKAC